MQQIMMNEFLKPLQQIQKIEAPQYLLTRIHQYIKNEAKDKISPSLAWILGLSFCLWLIINGMVVVHTSNNDNYPQKGIENTFHLMPENNLYP